MLIDDPVKAITLLFDNILTGNVKLDVVEAGTACAEEYNWLSDKFLNWKRGTILSRDEYDQAMEYFLSGRVYGWIKGVIQE